MLRNSGKLLEEKVAEVLRLHQAQQSSYFIRLYDATSSGGRGFKQPGDFIWLLPDKAVLIECKSTDTNLSFLELLKSKTSKQQIPKHKIWQMSGHPSIYIYLNKLTQDVQVFDAVQVFNNFQDTKEKKDLNLIASGTLRFLDRILSDVAYKFNTKRTHE